MSFNKFMVGTAFLGMMIAGAASAADYHEGLPGVTKNYVGVTVGSDINSGGTTSVGVVVGRDLNSYVTVEGQYEYRKNDSHLATTNVLVGPQMGAIKPYVMAGAGYKWTDNNGDYPVGVLGAGAKFSMSEQVDLDARLRHIISEDNGSEERVTLGVNFRF